MVDIIPLGPELLVSEGESVQIYQPFTSNPNVGGFGQGDVKIVPQEMDYHCPEFWSNIMMKIFMILFPHSICTCNSNPLWLYYTCMQVIHH